MSAPAAPTFTPAFAGYAQRVRLSFARQGAMALIGAQLVEVGPGHCAIALVPRPEMTQQHGYVHAGIVARSPTPPAATPAIRCFPRTRRC